MVNIKLCCFYLQPGSAISLGTGSHNGSTVSRRAQTRHYHVVSHTSQVDESLFGDHNRNKQIKNRGKNMGGGNGETSIEREAARRSAKNKRKSGSNKETVQVITKDLIRNLT